MGFDDITVYDRDIVEAHNLPAQFYRLEDLNQHKVHALQSIIQQFEGITIKTVADFFTPEKYSLQSQLVISAVDSIPARERIIRGIKMEYHKYIDSRMGGELMRIYTVDTPERLAEYMTTLKAPDEQVRCTARTILYNILTMAGIITSIARKIAVSEQTPYEVIFDIGSYTAIRND